MSCPPEDPKASDAGGMEEEEADERKLKAAAEPCPEDSHEGEGGGDIAKEPASPPSRVASPSSPSSPVAWPSSPSLPPVSRSRSSSLPSSPLASRLEWSPIARGPRGRLPPSPLGSTLSWSPVACGPRSRLSPPPLASMRSSSPDADHSARKHLRFYDRETASIPSSADPCPLKSSEDYRPEPSLGFVQEEDEYQDYEDQEDEIPYIGDKEPLSSLADEYKSSTSIFQRKIELLREKHSAIRRVKRDGNCFYRSFIFAYLEYLCESQNESEMVRVLSTVEEVRGKLFELGKSPIAVSNYCGVFIKMVSKIRKGKLNHTDILQSCRGYMSDDLVKFLRMVAACEMCRRKDHYEPFVTGMSNTTVEEYCKRSVEPLGEESDNMEIRALCVALGVQLRLENLDQSLTNGLPVVIGFDFGPNDDTADITQHTPLFTLLYRPGHYDILYRI